MADWLRALARTRAAAGCDGLGHLTGADKRVDARVLLWSPDVWVKLTAGI